MATTSRNARIPDEKWEAQKTDIVRQFIGQDQSLEDIVESLRSSRFIAPIGKAVWSYVDHRIAERRSNGKTSNVILNGDLFDSTKVNKETGRYSQRAWSTSIVPSSIWGSSVDKGFISNVRDSTILRFTHHSSRHSLIDSSLLIPESEENEAARRMKIIRSGTDEEALQEQFKILFLQVANKSLFEEEGTIRDSEWSPMVNLVKLMDFVGFTRKPMEPGDDTTLLAAREGLFQRALYSLTCTCEEKRSDLLNDHIKNITRFVEWLLLSGQDPNVPVRCGDVTLTSGLQSTLDCGLEGLTDFLLQNKADVRGYRVDDDCYHSRDCWVHLPPHLHTVAFGRESISKTILSNLGTHETILNDFLSFNSILCVHGREIPFGSDIDHPLYDMIKTPNREAEALAVLQYITGILGTVWFKTLNHSVGILFNASWAGNLDILEFLVHNNVDI
ncbi:Ankyrin repeat domain-containing protein 50 [Apiospora phragmitis]|uniref:Ankyrin repeat domain-containing protein 50 n=1 Tax=Apiospora phragmitis TaxID=2905665 RepID=A0ABR1W962_9PEZI